jgi:hypothetical protein
LTPSGDDIDKSRLEYHPALFIWLFQMDDIDENDFESRQEQGENSNKPDDFDPETVIIETSKKRAILARPRVCWRRVNGRRWHREQLKPVKYKHRKVNERLHPLPTDPRIYSERVIDAIDKVSLKAPSWDNIRKNRTGAPKWAHSEWGRPSRDPPLEQRTAEDLQPWSLAPLDRARRDAELAAGEDLRKHRLNALQLLSRDERFVYVARLMREEPATRATLAKALNKHPTQIVRLETFAKKFVRDYVLRHSGISFKRTV